MNHPYRSRNPRILSAISRFLLLGCVVSVALLWQGRTRADDAAKAIETRLADSARYLTSDDLAGRGAGTPGIDLAADFIAQRFADAGLKTDNFDGKPFQKFEHSFGGQLGKDNRLVLVGPAGQDGQAPKELTLAVGKDFTPISLSGAAEFDAPLVFGGYGISAKKEEYDDYAGLDIKGKIVVILRHEPQQQDPKSVFAGTRDSAYAALRRKVSNAVEHGAAGVILCTDENEIRKNLADLRVKWQAALDRLTDEHERVKAMKEPTPAELEAATAKIEKLVKEVDDWNHRLQQEVDPVLSFNAGGTGGAQKGLPVLHCRRAVLAPIVKAATGKDLAQWESDIDQGPTPHSQPLDGWRAVGKTDLKQSKTAMKNVVAVLEGEGDKAGETIVVGAHYDHLGMGGNGSLDRKAAIHPGADDNASGVTVMLEVARQLAARPRKLPRSVVFVAFTGEESGLLGSSYYAEHPLRPLDKTVAMINLDMVGRLRNEKLSIMGTGTSKQFGEVLDRVSAEGLKITRVPPGSGPSDQLAFYLKQVPVLFFFTGIHGEYHRPSDRFETLNIAGMRRIAQYVEDTVARLAELPDRPEFAATAAGDSRAGRKAWFGAVPDFGSDGEGFRLSEVMPGGPAEKAGVKGGDTVIEFGGTKISDAEEFMEALGKYKGGETVKTVVRRDDKTLTIDVTLGKR